MQKVVIQDAVIDPFACGALTVDLFILFRIPRDARLEAKVVVVFYVNRTAVTSRGTFFFVWAGIYAFAFEWAAVFMRIFYRVISPCAHFVACLAKGMAAFTKSDVNWGMFLGLCPSVDINERVDIPVFQQLISGKIVVGGVKADIFR